MLAGVSGDLISQAFGEQVLPTAFRDRLGERERERALRALRSWWRRVRLSMGPASSIRDLLDLGAAPVFETLGHRLVVRSVTSDPPVATATFVSGGTRATVRILPWGAPLGGGHAPFAAADHPPSWWGIVFNGLALRLVDWRRSYARRHLDFDLEAVLDHPPSFVLFWACLRDGALEAVLGSLISASAEHGLGVSAALRSGVLEGVELLMNAMARTSRRFGSRHHRAAVHLAAYGEAVTVAYRLLFLLFAESRGLLPTWHPVFREGYSIASLRASAERPGRHDGVWETLQAISRMAHTGCRLDDLHVSAFNGRLFSPARAALADGVRADDELVGRAIAALTTRIGPSGRERIAFRDLGVEELGAVYESLLDYAPVVLPAAAATAAAAKAPLVKLAGTGTKRKSSGTFYTPVAITDYVVRETLGPLIDEASPDDILRLKVVDPAMGSGAFLVAACRYLAESYERALVRHSGRMASDITDDERSSFRRLIARRCLYGVDINPMAVQVARLSMWLTTLAADRPLTFLDHHFAAGDSLVGASIDDVGRQRPGPSRTRWRGADELPFDPEEFGAAMRRALPVREGLALASDDSARSVHEKEIALRGLSANDAPLSPLRRLLDTWCAWWFWSDEGTPRPHAGEYAELLRAARGQMVGLRDRILGPRLGIAERTARHRRFFHWTLSFPEVFFDSSGTPLANPGFDAVVGNPPWEMVRGDTGEAADRAAARASSRQLTGFVRESGVYRASGTGHLNLYQLFVERAIGLTRPGGRVGLVVPWGLASDSGSAALRRLLFERCRTEALVGFDNASGIFPVHRGLRFLLLTASTGRPTDRTRCRFGLRHPSQLDDVQPSTPDGLDHASCTVTPPLLTTLSGQGLAVPWVGHVDDLRILERLTRRFPSLSEPVGWNARFGRELNATDDADLFEAREAPPAASVGATPGLSRRRRPDAGLGRPVVEGRHIEPFRVDLDAPRFRLRSDAALRPEIEAGLARWRLGYRDVASSTNRLTVIAGLIPPGAVTVHTVSCLRTRLPLSAQHVLCAILNSLVFNFLARAWVTTHVSVEIVERLPAPGRMALGVSMGRLERLSRRLGCTPDDLAAWASLQSAVAHAYGLSRPEFAQLLEAFPLIERAPRDAVLAAFDGVGSEV